MSALRSEYEDAVAEGVKFLWRTATQEFICDNNSGWITGLKVDTPEGEKVLSFNRILLAIGSRPANRIVSTTTGIDVDSSGYVITKDRPYGMTTRKGVFAGGDVVHTPQTVVLAMKEAKKVAVGIAQYVDAKKIARRVISFINKFREPEFSRTEFSARDFCCNDMTMQTVDFFFLLKCMSF